jgi:hypothetical protein
MKTVDPFIIIEEQREGYVRYHNVETGSRWEVHGICDRRGNCLIGAVIDTPNGKIQIENHEHLKQLREELDRKRIDSELDVPVGPGFTDCCPLKVVEL